MSFVLLGILNSQAAGAGGFPLPDVTPDLWLDAADSSTITESGGSVSQWDNKGTLENFTQATSADQPTTGVSTLNGLNVIDFSDEFFETSQKSQWKFLHDGTTHFVAIVAKFGNSNDPGVQYLVYGTGGNSSNNIGNNLKFDDRSPDNNLFLYFLANGSGERSVSLEENNFFSANTFLVNSILLDPDNPTAASRGTYFLNNTQGVDVNTETTSVSSSDPTFSFQLGSSGDGINNLTGSIGEIIIVSGADATEENRQAVVDYLNDKWSIF